MTARSLLHAAFLLGFVPVLSAQESFGGEPLSWQGAVSSAVPTRSLTELEPGSAGLAAGVGLENSGLWEDLGAGGRLWRLRLELPGALGNQLSLARFQLSPGASFYVYDDDRQQLCGAFTDLSNQADGGLELLPIAGEAILLEYHEPAGVERRGELVIGALRPALWMPGLRDPFGELDFESGPVFDKSLQSGRGKRDRASGVNSSPPCNVDVACPEGLPWAVAARSVVGIIVLNEFCTGVLLNNTANDGTPYILTARHCGSLNMASFRFNWLRSECAEGGDVPEGEEDLLSGSKLVAMSTESDFQLVRLASMPPEEFGALYAGWDRSNEAPEHTACLHHPVGDYMKVSLDADAPKAHKKHWRIGKWETGMTARGSSGAPLFDPENRMIGSLEGGDSTCKEPRNDYFVRMDVIWRELGPILDPIGSGVTQLDALDLSSVDMSLVVSEMIPAELTTKDRRIEIRGFGFEGKLGVRINGEKVDWRDVKLESNSRLLVELPELEKGNYTLKVWKGQESGALKFKVVDPPAPSPDDSRDLDDSGDHR